MNRAQEIYLVCSHELRRTLRSPKAAILLLLYALVATLAGLAFMHIKGFVGDTLDTTAGLGLAAEEADLYRKAVALFFGEGAAAHEWLFQVSPFLLFFYKFNLFFLPALVVLMGFDQISDELQTRSLRYLAPRIHRESVLFGKLLSQLVLVVLLITVMSLGALAFSDGAAKASWSVSLFGMLRFGGQTLLVMLAYLGLTALFSSLTRTPLYALVFSLCALIGLWLMGTLANFDSLTFLKWLTPTTYEPLLFSPQPLRLVGALSAYAAFTAIFLGGALLRLRRCDL
ncbi:MAG: ABC transporter permease subunit [Myxococcales bacterium]|jgi:ABC-type transport system involved in multi-copper enzyme maturation permease subunit|nr:ABC transporter permease subunit [Myxococcales bacterium]